MILTLYFGDTIDDSRSTPPPSGRTDNILTQELIKQTTFLCTVRLMKCLCACAPCCMAGIYGWMDGWMGQSHSCCCSFKMLVLCVKTIGFLSTHPRQEQVLEKQGKCFYVIINL